MPKFTTRSTKFSQEKIVLKKAGLKVTPSRIMLLKCFERSSAPLSADSIFKKLNQRLDLATVYRNLETFLDKKIIRKVDLGRNSISYELNSAHHHHLVCQKCGFVENFNLSKDRCEIDRLSAKVLHSASYFDKIIEHSLELFGVCLKCKK